eukprot:Seg1776.1 transcript_id=Seg1776.1/GoldUCD/mRNA.D3Y31 product="Potassium channel subfamily K member 9" protein_id=Seg1776.1/GoldUCD/D3Y31
MGSLLTQQNIRTLLLITCTVTYMLVGAAVFSALEYDKDQEERKKYMQIYRRLQREYNISKADMNELAKYLHKRKHVEYALEPWSFAGSVYFTAVTITTIGYGHSVPRTFLGKLFCILYAMIGVPLNLTMFQAIGERMGVLLSFSIKKLKICLNMKNTEVSLVQLVAVGLVLWIVSLCAGAALFSRFEAWDFFTSLYYFFVTLTTIGFGDLVALQEVKHERTRDKKTMYIAATMIMIYVGLTIASSVINLLVLRLMELQQPKKKRHKLSVQPGPRCNHCQNGKLLKVDTTEDSGIEANQSVMILKNFEDELSFTSYRQLHQKRKSI